MLAPRFSERGGRLFPTGLFVKVAFVHVFLLDLEVGGASRGRNPAFI